MKLQRLTIVMAEDDENDRFLFTRAIAHVGVKHHVRMVPNGAEVIRYLQGEAPYDDRSQYPFPNMLILDVKMPFVTGLEVLRWLRDHDACSVVPAIIFTSSCLPADVRESFRLGAGGYFIKPAELNELARVLKSIFDYWFLSQVPDPPETGRCS